MKCEAKLESNLDNAATEKIVDPDSIVMTKTTSTEFRIQTWRQQTQPTYNPETEIQTQEICPS